MMKTWSGHAKRGYTEVQLALGRDRVSPPTQFNNIGRSLVHSSSITVPIRTPAGGVCYLIYEATHCFAGSDKELYFCGSRSSMIA